MPETTARSRTRIVTRTESYANLQCTLYDDPCDSLFDWQVRTTGAFTLNFTSAPTNCATMRVRFQVDGQRFGNPDGYVVAPGQATGPVSEGAGPAGTRAVRLLVEAVEDSTCPPDPVVIFDWSGTLDATIGVPRKKRRRRK